jgi:acyl-CoA synthetase (AMP-forming)/AMP-acid ligase II
MLLGQLPVRSARRYPNKAAIVFNGKRTTFGAFNQRVNRCADALKRLGLAKGDKVAVLSRNRPEMLEVCFAAAKSGIIYVPVNFRLAGPEICFVVNDAEVKAFIVSDAFQDVLAPVRSQLRVTHQLSFEQDYERLLAEADDKEVVVELSPNAPFAIFYTSGTTGNPKGVLLSHRNFGANVMNEAIAYQLSQTDVCLHTLPLYHTAEASFALAQFYVGGTLVIVETYQPKAFWDLVDAERVTYTSMIFTMVLPILDEYERRGRKDRGSLRTLAVGGQTTPVEVIRRAIRLLGPQVMMVVYGLTESSPYLTYLAKHEMVAEGPESRRIASIGKEMFSCHVRVVDDTDRDVAPGLLGEVIARGPNVMSGYYRRPEETAAMLRNGWLRTGDIATVDDEGYIYIVDRKKDLIISGGENISPREVEDVLYQHPAIAECSVIGIPDQKWGEQVKAVIVLKPSAQADEAALIDFCRDRLAGYKRPRSISFVNSLPKDPLGKIQKRVLRQQFAEN